MGMRVMVAEEWGTGFGGVGEEFCFSFSALDSKISVE